MLDAVRGSLHPLVLSRVLEWAVCAVLGRPIADREARHVCHHLISEFLVDTLVYIDPFDDDANLVMVLEKR